MSYMKKRKSGCLRDIVITFGGFTMCTYCLSYSLCPSYYHSAIFLFCAVLYIGIRLYFIVTDKEDNYVSFKASLYTMLLYYLIIFIVGYAHQTEIYNVPVIGETYMHRTKVLQIKFHGSYNAIPYVFEKKSHKGKPEDYNVELFLKKAFDDYYIIESIQLIKRDEDNAGDWKK